MFVRIRLARAVRDAPDVWQSTLGKADAIHTAANTARTHGVGNSPGRIDTVTYSRFD